MSWAGGASSWYSRRQEQGTASDDELSNAGSLDEDEVPLDKVPLDKRRPAAAPENMTSETGDSLDIMSESTYQAVRDIFNPTNQVKKRTGELLLKARDKGQYRCFSGIDLDVDLLEHAGSLPSNVTHTDRLQYAEKQSEVECASRCGSLCNGDCRVRAFVTIEGHGTDFYYGSHEDVAQSVLTQGAACEVYIWDELSSSTMHKLNAKLEALLDTYPGIAMRTTELKTVPGKVRVLPAMPWLCRALSLCV